MNLIGISGKRRTGKSTFGEVLKQQFGYVPLSLATPLKLMCREQFGLTEDQTDGVFKEQPTQYWRPSRVAGFTGNVGEYWTPRQIMIEMGKFYRSIDGDFWIKRLIKQIQAVPAATSRTYVVTDVRFKNEAEWIKKYGGLLVRLERSEELTGASINDPSETELDSYEQFDIIIPAERNVNMDDLDVAAILVNDKLLTKK